MRKLTAIVVLCFLSSFYTLSAQETKDNSKNDKPSTEEYSKFRFGGYGEMVANFKDYGINRFYGGNDGNPNKKGIPYPSPLLYLLSIINLHRNGYSEQK